ncbi:MAG: CRTAC1 family protein [Acidobacteriota bacterium]
MTVFPKSSPARFPGSFPTALGALLLGAGALAGTQTGAPPPGGSPAEGPDGTAASPAEAPAPPAPAPFTDEAAASGLDFTHFNGMSGELYIVEVTGAGAALFDYDGDGDLDAYLVQGTMLGPDKELDDAVFPPEHPEPLSDRLYRNDTEVRPDGSRKIRFTDVTEESGVAELATGYGMGVAAGDYDNDGHVDLYLANFGSNQLLRNRGDGTFADATGAAGADDGRWSVAAAFLDYDRDGWLDLYVVNYIDFQYARHRKCTTSSGAPDYCSPLAYRPVADRLLRNLGPGEDGTVTFEDVSARVGIAEHEGNGLGVVTGDFDGDGWLDLYVANDQMANFLFMNREAPDRPAERAFREDAVLAGCAVNREGQPEASMGVDAADVDGDGDEDLFMTHLAGETNTFFRNEGDGLFLDRTAATALGPPGVERTAFGAGFLDWDNDGRLDVMVVNGAVTVIEEQARRGEAYPLAQPNQLFRNRGGLQYEDVTGEAGEVFRHLEVSRGLAFGDVDGDGDTDALLANNSGPARLLVNRVGQDRSWIGLRIVDGERDALGAWVEIHREGAPPVGRRVRTDGSYASARDPRVLVGLGDEASVEKVVVRWVDGTAEEWTAVPAGRYTTLERGTGEAVRRGDGE